MQIIIELTREERKVAEDYARRNSMSLSNAFKRALFEQIEDEYDALIADEAYQEYLKDPKTYSFEEAMKYIGMQVIKPQYIEI